MKQVLFFALRDDLVPVVEAAEASVQVKYARMGNFRSPEVETFSSALDIPELGKADFGTASGCASYLVSKRGTPLKVRPVAEGGGVSRSSVDQLKNPDTVVFTPAGIWSDDVLLHGRVATVSETTPAQDLMQLFRSAVKERFTKVRAFYLGPQALAWLHAGKRLTISHHSPREFDLTPAA